MKLLLIFLVCSLEFFKGGCVMDLMIKKCLECGGTSFTQASDHKFLRSLEKSFTKGSVKNFTVCISCGEVLSIKILHPVKERK